MKVVILLVAMAPVLAGAQSAECVFSTSEATISNEPSAPASIPRPAWFTVTGRAEVTTKGNALEARLFDSRLGGQLSHTLRGTLAGVEGSGTQRSHRVAATLRTLGTDAGDQPLNGSYSLTLAHGSVKFWVRSLVLRGTSTMLGITCHEKAAT
jgi:hypothetical protein